MVGYKVGALFGGGLLAWFSVYCSWEWLFTLWGAFYIAILIVLLLNKNTKSCSHHSKREEVTYRDCSKENIHDLDISANSKHREISSVNHIPIANDHTCKTERLSVKHIMGTIFKMSDFLWLVCCVLTYKLGEQGVVSMLPLYMIDQGIPQDQVGVIFGIFGQVFSITGSTLGGWIVGLHHGQR